jgi:uncharacterized protein Smg (DUF494 family)
MKIEKVYIGGWFQRTTLQLSEVYDFLRFATSELALEKEKLKKLHKNLGLKEVTYDIDSLELLRISTTDNIDVKIYEDGLIVLGYDKMKEYSLFTDIDNLANYYEKKLSPALSYLFSLGAPVPKELANIETVYPYFVVLKNETKEHINELLAKTENEKYFEFTNKDYDVLRGNKYYFINNKNKTTQEVERYIEEQIFVREFKAQMHRYLNIHRIIWERIDEVKENAKVSGKDIIKLNSKIEGYQKTVNLIDGRINQMSTYLSTREKIAKSDEKLKESLEMIGYRYETLGNTLRYIQYLWDMTQNYVNSARSLFKSLQSNVTDNSINNLTIVTSMGVGASFLSLFTESAPTFTLFGLGYFFALALLGWTVNKIMKTIARKKIYEVSDIEYDKDIK